MLNKHIIRNLQNSKLQMVDILTTSKHLLNGLKSYKRNLKDSKNLITKELMTFGR